MNPATRLLLWLAGWIGLLLIVAAIVVMVTVTQARRALEETRADLERRGESLSISALAPPEPPTEGNGAEAMIEAAIEIGDIAKSNETKRITVGQKETDPGFAEVLHRRHAALNREDDLPWEKVAAGLLPMQNAMAALRASAQSPHLASPLDYGRGFSMPMDKVTPLLSAAQYLSKDALFQLYEGRTKAAVADIVTLLRMADLPGQQPILISQLVAASMIGIAQLVTWEALQSPLTREELAELQTAWERTRRSRTFTHTLRMERATAAGHFAEFSRSMGLSAMTSSPTSALPTSLDELSSMISFGSWKFLFRYSDERQFLLNYQALIDSMPPGLRDNWRPILDKGEEIEATLAGAGIGRMFSSMVIPTLRSSINRLATIDATRNLTITAIAIRRYALDHGNTIPPSLDALVPDYLDSVPGDALDSGSLRYEPLNGGSYILYSVGLNGIDDGGDASPMGSPYSRHDRKDIVWPRVASKNEGTQEQPADAAP